MVDWKKEGGSVLSLLFYGYSFIEGSGKSFTVQVPWVSTLGISKWAPLPDIVYFPQHFY